MTMSGPTRAVDERGRGADGSSVVMALVIGNLDQIVTHRSPGWAAASCSERTGWCPRGARSIASSVSVRTQMSASIDAIRSRRREFFSRPVARSRFHVAIRTAWHRSDGALLAPRRSKRMFSRHGRAPHYCHEACRGTLPRGLPSGLVSGCAAMTSHWMSISVQSIGFRSWGEFVEQLKTYLNAPFARKAEVDPRPFG